MFTGFFLALLFSEEHCRAKKYRQFDGIFDGTFAIVSEVAKKVPSFGGFRHVAK